MSESPERPARKTRDMRPVTVEVVTSNEPMTQEALERWARNYLAAVVGLDREDEGREDDTSER